MNRTVVVLAAAIGGMSAGSAQGGPALLDYPGPGYREQAGLTVREPERKDVRVEVPSDWVRFPAPNLVPLDSLSPNPFSKPIRLFDFGSGPAKPLSNAETR